tara:strand:- start:10 stop:1038 length:1029 start_codon:yes stop_codon:yes gene_type:complete
MPNRKEHIFENNIEKKHCPTCDSYQTLSDFTKQKSSWDGLCRMCRQCTNEYKRNKRQNDPKYKETERIYNEKYVNSGKRKEVSHERYLKKKDKIIAQCVAYQKKKREDRKLKQQMASDICFKENILKEGACLNCNIIKSLTSNGNCQACVRNETLNKMKDIVYIDINETTTKVCTKCKEEKTIDNFYVHKMKKSIRAECKQCSSKSRKERYKNNREAIIKQTTAYQNEKRKIDPAFKMEKNLRNRLYQAMIHQNAYKCDKTMTLIGCSKSFLKKYIEEKFLNGMVWENYGSMWVIDHIKPCCVFNLEDENDQRKCFHFTNLQPLWKEQNSEKGGKYHFNLPS